VQQVNQEQQGLRDLKGVLELQERQVLKVNPELELLVPQELPEIKVAWVRLVLQVLGGLVLLVLLDLQVPLELGVVKATLVLLVLPVMESPELLVQ